MEEQCVGLQIFLCSVGEPLDWTMAMNSKVVAELFHRDRYYGGRSLAFLPQVGSDNRCGRKRRYCSWSWRTLRTLCSRRDIFRGSWISNDRI